MNRRAIAMFAAALGLILSTPAAEAQTNKHTRPKTVVGCLQGSPNHYELNVVSKKGKKKQYELVGNQDFASDVGQKVQAVGTGGKAQFKVKSLKGTGQRCR